MANALDEARGLVENRLADLNDERERLERALKELGGSGKRRGRSRGSSSTGKARRRRRGGTRADEAVKLIEKQPGITASEIARVMKIKPNYLYRVLSDLEKQKRVKKSGRKYTPAGAKKSPAKTGKAASKKK